MHANTVAILPLRGGSKSIPDKNIKVIAGKPLFAWSLLAAQDARIFDKIFISTDSLKIAEAAATYLDKNSEVIMRNPELATDSASTESVLLDFADKYSFNTICLLQATSPLTTANDLKLAFSYFEKNKYDSLVTGVTCKRFLWDKKSHSPVNYNPLFRPRRQEFDGYLMENGAFYFTRKEILLKYQSRLGGKIGLYEMAQETGVEIDETDDWWIVEKLILKHKINKTAEDNFSI